MESRHPQCYKQGEGDERQTVQPYHCFQGLGDGGGVDTKISIQIDDHCEIEQLSSQFAEEYL